MATQTRPFMMTGAALVSAAAIVAATPAIAPSISMPASAALSKAQFELTTFSDLLSIPANGWTTAFFSGYGGAVGASVEVNPSPPPTTVTVPNPYAPWCYNNCYAYDIPGMAYLAVDALVNGNGTGYTPVYDANGNPTAGYQTWNVSAVNYYFEGGQQGGVGPFLQYVADNSIGAANPLLGTLIGLIFAGPSLVTTVWNNTWKSISALISKVPLVGPVISGGINAMLYGPVIDYSPKVDPVTGQVYYAAVYGPNMVPGILNYTIQVLTNSVPKPPATPAAAARSAASLVSKASAATAAQALTATAPTAAADDAGAPSASDAVSATKADTDVTPSASDVKAEAGSTESTGSESTGSSDTTDTKTVDSTADDSTPALSSAPVATSAKSADAPVAKTRKHPVRDAVQKAAKQIQTALGGAKAAAKAGKAAG